LSVFQRERWKSVHPLVCHRTARGLHDRSEFRGSLTPRGWSKLRAGNRQAWSIRMAPIPALEQCRPTLAVGAALAAANRGGHLDLKHRQSGRSDLVAAKRTLPPSPRSDSLSVWTRERRSERERFHGTFLLHRGSMASSMPNDAIGMAAHGAKHFKKKRARIDRLSDAHVPRVCTLGTPSYSMKMFRFQTLRASFSP
jgi:hypothetical protein